MKNLIFCGKELLIQKATGYVSFVSGDNPYTFPYRILPKHFLAKKYLLNVGKRNTYPTKTVDGRDILDSIKRLDLVMNKIIEINELLSETKSKILFCMHDSFVIDLCDKDKPILKDILKIFSETQYGEYKVNLNIGRDFSKMKELLWKQ